MAGCALNCFSFTAHYVSGIAFSSPVSAALKPVAREQRYLLADGQPALPTSSLLIAFKLHSNA